MLGVRHARLSPRTRGTLGLRNMRESLHNMRGHSFPSNVLERVRGFLGMSSADRFAYVQPACQTSCFRWVAGVAWQSKKLQSP